MRIGLTCTTIEPVLTQGKIDGIGIYTKTLLEQFQALHHDVVPYSFLNKHQPSEFSHGKKFPLSYTASSIISLISPLTNRLYANITHQIDLLHVTDHKIPRIKKIPVIATIHDALMFKHPEWYRSKTRSLKNALRKETMQWASHFITISHAMVPELVELLGIKEEKISVVYNGTN